MVKPGTLYVIGVPIGNQEDISQRAIEVLSRVDTVAGEDTRTAQQLLRSCHLTKPTISYYDQVEREKAPRLIALLQEGRSIGLISEAGTPGISDPGYVLVRQAREAGIPVIPVPGPSAAIAALSVSGIPSNAFVFKGFLPKKEGQLTEELRQYRNHPETLIFYESPRRIRNTLRIMQEVFGERLLFLAREMTKKHEEYFFGTLTKVAGQLKEPVLGEITCVLEGSREEKAVSPEHIRLLQKMTEAGMSSRDAVQIVADVFSVPRNDLKRSLHR